MSEKQSSRQGDQQQTDKQKRRDNVNNSSVNRTVSSQDDKETMEKMLQQLESPLAVGSANKRQNQNTEMGGEETRLILPL